MKSRFKTPNELRQAGIAALVKTLGPVDATQFLRLFDAGSGDYTRRRRDLLGNPSVDEVISEMKQWKKNSK